MLPYSFSRVSHVAAWITAACSIQAAIPVVPIYSEDPVDGFNATEMVDHPTLGRLSAGQMRRKVLQAAADYVGSLFDPSYDGEQIRITVAMVPLDPDFVGFGGPSEFQSGFGSSNPKYQANLSYPAALANHLAERNLVTGAHADLQLNLNYPQWDYGIAVGHEEGKDSFYTTSVHEVLHGMGFLSGVGENGAFDPGPTPMDGLLVVGQTQRTRWTSLSNEARKAAVVGEDLFLAGPLSMEWNPLDPGQPARVNAPSTYSSGSSTSHWDPNTWNPFGLMMLPSASPDVPEKVYLVAMERGFFYDMGYTPALPRISISFSAGKTQVQFKSIQGAHYVLRATSSLPSAGVDGWMDLTPATQATGNSLTFVDSSGGATARFYHVEEVADPLAAIRPTMGIRPATLGRVHPKR